MNKICTSIEQSKKLMELGIDRKSSDMYYWCGSDLRIGGYKAQDEELDIPAWSLAALLNVLPKGEYKDTDLCCGGYKGDGYIPEWFCSYEQKEPNIIEICHADNPIDACYEMIVTLHEQKML